MKKKINFRRMLANIGLLTVIVPTSLTVVACGTNSITENKINLSDILTNKTVASDTTETNIIERVLDKNPETNLQASDLKVLNFKEANYQFAGSAILEAQENSKFTGSVNIVITAKAKLDLNKELTNKTVASDTTETNIIERVLDKNPETNLQASDLQIKADSFHESLPDKEGSAILEAQENSKFTGSVNIVITAKAKLDLNKELTNKTVASDTTETNIIERVLDKNPETNLQASDLQIKADSFHESLPDKEGSAILEAQENSKFTGSVNIVITAKAKLDLNKELTNKTVASDTTETNIIERVLDKNPETNLQASDLQIKADSFHESLPDKEGSAILEAQENSKFTGSVNIVITAKAKLDLNKELGNLTVATNTTEIKLIERVLRNNPNTNLTSKDLIIESFKAPTKTTDGSAVLTASSESDFSGKVTISIPASSKQLLNRIIITRVIDSNTSNSKEALLNTIIKQYAISANDIFIKDFTAATETEYGKATLSTTDNARIAGEVEVVINKLDDNYGTLIKNLKSASDRTSEKKQAWMAYFAYRLKQFTELYSQGLLIADFDGTTNKNAWQFFYWIIRQQRVELMYQGVRIDYEESFVLNNQRYEWDLDNNIVFFSTDFIITFWDNIKETINIKDFKIFYEINNITDDVIL